MRKALVFPLEDSVIHGTVHSGDSPNGLGVIFFNSGAQPRSSRGDFSVHTADALADHGFTCVRIDLPGLGDSSGSLPAHYAELYDNIQNGAYRETAVHAVRHVHDHFSLSSVFLLGLCGGAATALFTSLKINRPKLAGLILLDLPFEHVQEYDTPAEPPGTSSKTVPSRPKLLKRKLHDWLLRQSWEPQATAVYHAAKRFSSYFKPARLPAQTNRPLLSELISVLEKEIPVLLISAVPVKNAAADLPFYNHLKARAFRSFEHHQIHGTTHSFVENDGQQRVLQVVNLWLKNQGLIPCPRNSREHVPVARREQDLQNADSIL